MSHHRAHHSRRATACRTGHMGHGRRPQKSIVSAYMTLQRIIYCHEPLMGFLNGCNMLSIRHDVGMRCGVISDTELGYRSN